MLLQLFWLPPYYWWGLIGLSLVGGALLFAWRYYRGPVRVGIDDAGAYRQTAQHLEHVTFIRANGVQLIAMPSESHRPFKALIWPSYCVIYRDSVPYETYRLLRSYAVQQMILKQGDTKSRF